MRRLTVFFTSLVLMCSVSAFAEGEIGVIKTASGEVSVVRGDVLIAGTVGTTLFEKDILKTGPQGAVGVVMNDDTTLSLGPGSELSLKEYVFNSGLSENDFSQNSLKRAGR